MQDRRGNKMRAFVRFRDVEDGRFVAWFEPEHHILRRVAGRLGELTEA